MAKRLLFKPDAVKGSFTLVLTSIQGGWRVHSIHFDHETAKQWADCLEHNGEDCNLALLSEECLQEFCDHWPKLYPSEQPDDDLRKTVSH